MITGGCSSFSFGCFTGLRILGGGTGFSMGFFVLGNGTGLCFCTVVLGFGVALFQCSGGGLGPNGTSAFLSIDFVVVSEVGLFQCSGGGLGPNGTSAFLSIGAGLGWVGLLKVIFTLNFNVFGFLGFTAFTCTLAADTWVGLILSIGTFISVLNLWGLYTFSSKMLIPCSDSSLLYRSFRNCSLISLRCCSFCCADFDMFLLTILLVEKLFFPLNALVMVSLTILGVCEFLFKSKLLVMVSLTIPGVCEFLFKSKLLVMVSLTILYHSSRKLSLSQSQNF